MGRVRHLVLRGQTGGQMPSITEAWSGEEAELSFQSSPLQGLAPAQRKHTLSLNQEGTLNGSSKMERQSGRLTDRHTDPGKMGRTEKEPWVSVCGCENKADKGRQGGRDGWMHRAFFPFVA